MPSPNTRSPRTEATRGEQPRVDPMERTLESHLAPRVARCSVLLDVAASVAFALGWFPCVWILGCDNRQGVSADASRVLVDLACWSIHVACFYSKAYDWLFGLSMRVGWHCHCMWLFIYRYSLEWPVGFVVGIFRCRWLRRPLGLDAS